jgi:hypothetical protein
MKRVDLSLKGTKNDDKRVTTISFNEG